MKKFLFSVAAVMFGVTTAMAQLPSVPAQQALSSKLGKTVIMERSHSAANMQKGASKIAKAMSLTDDQMLVGPYTSDELAEDGLGLAKYPGDYKVGAILDAANLKKFDGAKIVAMRFGLCYTVGASRVFVATVSGSSVGDDVVSQAVSSTVAGWNEVTLDEPYTISADGTNTLMLGFDYTQPTYDSKNALASYPLSSVGDGYEGGFMLYTENTWYSQGSNYGCLSVQCVVEKEGLSKVVDVAMDALSVPTYAKRGEKATVSFAAHNYGPADVANCTFGVSVDGTEVATLEGQTVKHDAQAYSVDIDVNDSYNLGQTYNVAAYLKSVAGEAPAGDTDDDTLASTMIPYVAATDRQMNLVEQITGTWCQYCSYGSAGIKALTESRSDVAWVALHSSDSYSVSAGTKVINFMNPSGVPSASINRAFFSGASSIAFGIGYSDASYLGNLLSQMIDATVDYYPTFTSVDVTTDYDSISRKLTIDVTGEGVEGASSLLSGNTLTVYLVEDGIVGSQKMPAGTTSKSYEHHAVLRKVFSAYNGDAINWEGDSFHNTYSATLNSKWVAENMRVVAFVSRSITDESGVDKTDYSDVWVNNTNQKSVLETTTGVKGIAADTDNRIVGYYTVDGVKLGTAAKGLNIVRMSDGTSRKVMVK